MTADCLKGKVGLVTGIANASSLAWGCARAFHAGGAELAVTYFNDKAEPHVRPLATAVGAPIVMPLDVTKNAQMQDLFDRIGDQWGKLDFLLHAIAFAPKADLHGRVADCSLEGFLTAMDISCHSFIRMAHMAEPLMSGGGSLLTLSYHGARQVVPQYNMMGPVKAALEATMRELASELGKKHIRVNALSPGPVPTRAASGIAAFEDLLEQARKKAPQHELVSLDSVGAYARFLVSDDARLVTGRVAYVDAGSHIMASQGD